MNRLLLTLAFLLVAFAPMKAPAYSIAPRCFENLQTTFFDPYIVAQAMSLYFQNQSQWEVVNRELQIRSQDVPRILRERTSRMVPDPLRNPFQAEVVEQMLLEILYEIFADVLHQRNFTVNYDVRAIFQFIYRKQIYRFDECLGPYRIPKNQP